MAAEKQNPYKAVSAAPVKSFFVHMLTRDIRLEDAILDLLDNCVDGILRAKRSKPSPRRETSPYAGFWAEIKFDKTSFSIADNCGGIPWSLHEYAFRMGRDPSRPPDALGTVGAYGVGMKRAIFKLGTQCVIETKNATDAYEVDIPQGWMEDETNWSFPALPTKKMKHEGTTLVVGSLHPGISDRFSVDAQDFQSKLERMVATHYAFIIHKGLKVSINGIAVRPRPTKLLFTRSTRKAAKKIKEIQPFLFRTKTADGVEVFLAVGFTQPIPSLDQVENEQTEKRYSSEDAGWTIVCNDRAVVYCDRTELTGWGEAGIPRYHTQFIAISGVVEFKGDASKLPTTTTKRDVDASSPLYLQVKNKMREGMRIFTDYTNKWKARADESRDHMKAGTLLTLEEVKVESAHLKFTPTTTSVPPGEQYKPQLPTPKKLDSRYRRISYVKTVEDVQKVAEHMFDEPDMDPSEVGEACFDAFLKEAR
ncbi:MAG TPA: ATP-binding protein [Candidatus Eisenbacteria bacterium]|nr:ATP-binding protein [Candidatus Eisenbacteria bacterium]